MDRIFSAVIAASVGFIALFGIAVGNGMVLVAYLDQLVREGRTIDEASIEGGCLRLRPVLMTATAAMIGLVPLLFASGTGSEVQRPLATVVVGGLITICFSPSFPGLCCILSLLPVFSHPFD